MHSPGAPCDGLGVDPGGNTVAYLRHHGDDDDELMAWRGGSTFPVTRGRRPIFVHAVQDALVYAVGLERVGAAQALESDLRAFDLRSSTDRLLATGVSVAWDGTGVHVSPDGSRMAFFRSCQWQMNLCVVGDLHVDDVRTVAPPIHVADSASVPGGIPDDGLVFFQGFTDRALFSSRPLLP